ncbi:hypothetical protein BKI52_16965 [marine bacterium AO1-C]|nr:hypothetical protein BKI52_16965 [marine bacterium AO1-C]
MKQTKESTFWISYLRSFITVLVVWHHANLAYTTFARFDKEIYINSTHPVVDTQRWLGLDIIVNFNDIYFMSLMFLIGGLFLIKSIQRKGPKQFINDRFRRLLIPFITLATFFTLIAYLPAYYLSKGTFYLPDYIIDFFTTQGWPVGPPWFIWLLFVFNLLFALSYKGLAGFYNKVGQRLNQWREHPIQLIIGLIVLTALWYIPLSYQLGASAWTGIGPFDFQLNRILLYLGYFLIGVIIGSIDFNNTLFAAKSKLVKYWKLWSVIALIVFVLLILITPYLTSLVIQKKIDAFYAWMIYYFIYTLSCCFTSLAMLTVFKALVKTTHPIWNSLTENAYMIYLCHYPFIIWTQFFLLEFKIHAIFKFGITFIVSLLLSWWLSIQLRKISYLKRYV